MKSLIPLLKEIVGNFFGNWMYVKIVIYVILGGIGMILIGGVILLQLLVVFIVNPDAVGNLLSVFLSLFQKGSIFSGSDIVRTFDIFLYNQLGGLSSVFSIMFFVSTLFVSFIVYYKEVLLAHVCSRYVFEKKTVDPKELIPFLKNKEYIRLYGVTFMRYIFSLFFPFLLFFMSLLGGFVFSYLNKGFSPIFLLSLIFLFFLIQKIFQYSLWPYILVKEQCDSGKTILERSKFLTRGYKMGMFVFMVAIVIVLSVIIYGIQKIFISFPQVYIIVLFLIGVIVKDIFGLYSACVYKLALEREEKKGTG